MKKHWVNFLDEVGKPLKDLGYWQQNAMERIKSHENAIKDLKMKYEHKEKIIESMAAADWSPQEIEQAKTKSLQQL